MSFSGTVKEELVKHSESHKRCDEAELAAILMFCGVVEPFDGSVTKIHLSAENDFVLRKGFTLCKKNINIKTEIQKTTITIPENCSFQEINWKNAKLLSGSNCKRAFLRGAYLCVGSMSDPEKSSYHLEFDCPKEEEAFFLQDMIRAFGIEAKIVERKKYHVVYVKEGTAVSDLLNIMGAHVSLMNFENFRIIKEMRNSINRQVNCETANIAKTASASAKQIQDILLISDTYGLGELPSILQEIANIRLENQEATLQELGDMLNPPVGKSGVNHRLKKISEIANKIREQ